MFDFFFTVHLSIIFRKATDFRELILYPAKFAGSAYLMKEFLSRIFRVSYVSYPTICKYRYLDFFLSNLYPLVSVSCVITLAKTSSTVLNRCGESGQPVLLLIIVELL